MRRIVANVLLAVLSLAATAAIGEFATRLIYPDVMRLLGDIDHRMEPNGKAINSDGIRYPLEADMVRTDDVNVLFLGDSFVYGFGLAPHKALPVVLEGMAREKLPDRRINIINFGWTSSSPYLSLRLLRDIGARY